MLVIDNAVDFCELNCSGIEHLTHLYLPFTFLDKVFSSNISKQKFLDNLKQCKNLQSLNIDNNDLDDLVLNEIYSVVPWLKKTRTPFKLPDGWYLSQDLSQEELIEIIDIAEYRNKHNPLINNFCEYVSDIDDEDISNSNFPVSVSVVDTKAYVIADYDTNKMLSYDKKIIPAIYKSVANSKKTRLISTWLKRNTNSCRRDQFIPCDQDLPVAKKLRMR